MTEPAIEGVVVDDDQHIEQHPVDHSTEVVRRERRSEVIRPLDADQLIESFTAYQDLLPRLLDASDYQDAGRGKRFVKKSGWRKIATAFDLDVQLIRSTIERDETGQPLRAEVWARAIAPSGRSMDGDGYCSVDEERFSGPRGNKSKLENDLRATATTRAMNRAISGLVGMGDVSAEEVDNTPPEPWWVKPATDDRKREALDAAAILVGERDTARALLKSMADQIGVMPDVIPAALKVLAAAAQSSTVEPTPGDGQPDPAPEGEPVQPELS